VCSGKISIVLTTRLSIMSLYFLFQTALMTVFPVLVDQVLMKDAESLVSVKGNGTGSEVYNNNTGGAKKL